MIKTVMITGLFFNCAPVKAGFLWDIFVGYFFLKGLFCSRNILIHCEHCSQIDSNAICAYCGNEKTEEQKKAIQLKKEKARKAYRAQQVKQQIQNQQQEAKREICTDICII